MSELGKPPERIPEYQQPVGLYVHVEPGRFYYPGATSAGATGDVAHTVAFHAQEVLPVNMQSALAEVFKKVELKEPGPGGEIMFETPNLPGYFEVQVHNIRYDYPDPGAFDYRADVQLKVVFKTLAREIIWSGIFEGSGYSRLDPAYGLTEFDRGVAGAVNQAFQDVVDTAQDQIRKAQVLRDYFRRQGGTGVPLEPPTTQQA